MTEEDTKTNIKHGKYVRLCELSKTVRGPAGDAGRKEKQSSSLEKEAEQWRSRVARAAGELRFLPEQQTIERPGRVKIRRVLGESNSADSVTKVKTRRDIDKLIQGLGGETVTSIRCHLQ